ACWQQSSGCTDTQVKVLGHRIALTAIESELCRCPGILEAACRVQANGSGPEIVAFVVTEGGVEPDRVLIGTRLRNLLPEASVPTQIARLAALPRAALSGKLDRRAPPQPARTHVPGPLP